MCLLQAQRRSFTIFVIEQSAQYLFNRGALLNIGFQLLKGSDYDYFAFQDVDTVPTDRGKVQYSYPAGVAPLHLTPYGIHPTANFEVRASSCSAADMQAIPAAGLHCAFARAVGKRSGTDMQHS